MSDIMSEIDSQGFQTWLDDMTSIDTKGYGTDTTPILQSNPIADYINTHPLDQNALLLQQWILGKESGLQTRSAMGYGAVYLCSRVLESIQLYNDLYSRQSDVEQRMTNTEGDFKTVIANATKDSEVILARNSDTYGSFATLDARLENDEKILAQFAPVGFRVTINHGLGINPAVSVYYYEDAIGTEANGLATASHGLGEINTQSVACLPTYPDANALVVDMPMNFKLNGTPQLELDGNFYLIDGNKTLKFDIGGLLKPRPNFIADGGFESGQAPVNYAWGDSKYVDRVFQVCGQTPSFPTPFGKYMLRIENDSSDSSLGPDQYAQYTLAKPVYIKKGETWTYSYNYAVAGSATAQASDYLLTTEPDPLFALSMAHDLRDTSGDQTTWHQFVKTWTADRDVTVTTARFGFVKTSASSGWVCIDNVKLENGRGVTPTI